MYLERENITRALLETLGDRLTAIYDKSESTLPYKAAIDPHNGYLYGKADHFVAQENGLKFNVDWLEGQKTGFLSTNGKTDICSKNMPVINRS